MAVLQNPDKFVLEGVLDKSKMQAKSSGLKFEKPYLYMTLEAQIDISVRIRIKFKPMIRPKISMLGKDNTQDATPTG